MDTKKLISTMVLVCAFFSQGISWAFSPVVCSPMRMDCQMQCQMAMSQVAPGCHTVKTASCCDHPIEEEAPLNALPSGNSEHYWNIQVIDNICREFLNTSAIYRLICLPWYLFHNPLTEASKLDIYEIICDLRI